MHGQNWGIREGGLWGYYKAIKEYAPAEFEKIKSSEKSDTILDETPVPSYSLPKDNKEAVAQIDAFFQTFPLCKKKDFDLIIWYLFQIWEKDSPTKTSYKKISEICLE